MAARTSLAARLLGGGAIFGAGYGASSPSSFGDFIKDNLSASLAALLSPPAASAAAAVPDALAQAIARSDAISAASLRAIEQLLKAQRSSASWRMVLLLLPVAAGLCVGVVNWRRFGWVTGEQLQEGLIGVRDAAVGAVRQLGDTLHAAISRVDIEILETRAVVEQVKEEVTLEVKSVAVSVEALEKRMAPIESDVHRSAQGIDVLCQLVATSGLLANASAESLRQLDDFTAVTAPRGQRGQGTTTLHQHLALGTTTQQPPQPPARPELLPPASTPPQEAGAASLERAAPAFLRAAIGAS